jgi:hypothetical protein
MEDGVASGHGTTNCVELLQIAAYDLEPSVVHERREMTLQPRPELSKTMTASVSAPLSNLATRWLR